MARDLPHPTPEGALIRRVRESLRPRITIGAAAKEVGITPEMWGHIERGHRSGGRGADRVKVVAPASTLAHMAYVIGLTPADLASVGRTDAATVLAEMHGGELLAGREVMEAEIDRGRMWVVVPENLSEENREVIKRWAEEMASRLADPLDLGRHE